MSLCAPVNELRLLDQMGTGTVYVRHSLVRKLGRWHDVTRTRHVEDKIAESKTKTTEMAIAPGKLQVTRQVYLWLMACMYLFAFTSLYSQIPGKLLFPTMLFVFT